jgi:Holliday junction resolvase RusA-like endonuclease
MAPLHASSAAMIAPLPVHLRDCGGKGCACRCPCHSPAWSFTVPGPIPSTNHSYRPVMIGGKPRIIKAAGVEHWQSGVALIVRSAKPKGWLPADQVRVIYDFKLNRRADCDNAMKALNDAIAAALGVNDDIFLPCARSKAMGFRKIDARVEVMIANKI